MDFVGEALKAIEEVKLFHTRQAVSLPMADIQEVLRIKDVKVFEICDSDAVAATSLEEALIWYTEFTGIDLGELYKKEDIQEVERSHMVWDDETRTKKISVGEILGDYWNGEPFIVYSDNY